MVCGGKWRMTRGVYASCSAAALRGGRVSWQACRHRTRTVRQKHPFWSKTGSSAPVLVCGGRFCRGFMRSVGLERSFVAPVSHLKAFTDDVSGGGLQANKTRQIFLMEAPTARTRTHPMLTSKQN